MDNGIATSSLAIDLLWETRAYRGCLRWLRFASVERRPHRLNGQRLAKVLPIQHSSHGSPQATNLLDPEVALQKKNRAEALRQSLPRLSPEHPAVIDIAYYHGKSVKEIAEIVGSNEATVKTRMFYARKKLAELVAKA